jgi:hypothetical protein
MLDYEYTRNTLHARGIKVSVQQYLYVLNVVLGEKPAIAYGIIYDSDALKKALDEEELDRYVSMVKEKADVMLKQQDEIQLLELLQSDYNRDIQEKAMNLENYEFTTGQVVQILQNLLHSRSQDIESSSVRDIISLINTLASQGALSGSDNFASHFIQIMPKFNAVCKCGREIDVVRGIDCTCPYCHQFYKWVEEEDRFYPKPDTL